MDRLMITLPTLNREWIKYHCEDIEERAFDEFEMTPVRYWAAELDSSDFEREFEGRSYHTDVQNWYLNFKDNYVYHKIPEYVERIFREKNIWEKRICTEELVDTYHAALVDVSHWLAFNIALSWAKALECEVGQDWGVTPHKESR